MRRSSNRMLVAVVAAFAAGLGVIAAATPGGAGRSQAPATLTIAGLAGAWSGTISHRGETTTFGLEFEPAAEGKVTIRATVPSIYLTRQPLGLVVPEFRGPNITVGPFAFVYDPGAGTLTGVVPEGLAPVYRIPLILRRVDRLDTPGRAEVGGDVVQPVWTADLGSPLWAGPTCDAGTVYVGGQDGRLHAVESRTGRLRWSCPLGGAIRTRPAVAGGFVYTQADDGVLYKVAAGTGEVVWKVRFTERPIERLPFDNPKSRYDRFGADVVVDGERLYLGTHDGQLLALDAATGSVLWRFAAGDAILAAPALVGGRLYFGSFDKHVYAIDASTGSLRWKRRTEGAVVSTPAVAGDLVIVGNRAYDLVALSSATGDVIWQRYVWFSWVESSATVRDGIAYVGSSDAARVFAFDARTGGRVWAAEVFGWAWGQPGVSASRVYVGTSSQAGYPGGHRPGVLALDRATGRPVWRSEVPAEASGAFGYPGSPALGEGLVFAGDLGGRLRAFMQ